MRKRNVVLLQKKSAKKREYPNQKKGGDAHMDTNILIVIIQLISTFIALGTAGVLYKTIQNDKILNQDNLFNELVKQQREIGIKLNEYKEKMDENENDFEFIAINYDTLLFDYYEYLAVCIHQKLLNEENVKLYFKKLLISVKEHFYETSVLFKGNYAARKDYPSIRWLFKKWDIEY